MHPNTGPVSIPRVLRECLQSPYGRINSPPWLTRLQRQQKRCRAKNCIRCEVLRRPRAVVNLRVTGEVGDAAQTCQIDRGRKSRFIRCGARPDKRSALIRANLREEAAMDWARVSLRIG